ncbi:unnamed protein product [Aphanomyces euteiches]|uniref:SAM-dependent MTase RsmB/NOP-type domain-containing protein n=1 Tax=Aphanomyces euteiches TaxID=100861 RepID=A0A6G0WN06_9STRA|nr:hypothetical protein Ae201684_013664 [Aphanomyces euteiches]KAH9093697.1 hypothetical protein Ae201684P_016321 [Aphanomyces euteiches]KAH9143741.1 hypothetical protein AeRB84_012278 [Aphanomyces euteiches]KAH9143977.1 hypothetical protein AeRB84_012073 [Aphanomyces euteiches]
MLRLTSIRHMTTFRETRFAQYYVAQKVFPEDQVDDVIATLRTPLPSCFRINPNAPNFASIHEALRSEFQFSKDSIQYKEAPVTPPRELTWFPREYGSAWQLECGKAILAKLAKENKLFRDLHQFLILHTSAGSMTRQEAVSMIPTLFLDVQPGQRVLDMCAAPGSKTSQILETLLRGSSTQDGFVVANDASEKRGYMLAHQMMRLGLMSAVVTCHPGQLFPGLYNDDGMLETTNAFDRVLCDVPCTGDGTLRKNENIWRRWHVGDALTLHPTQLEIALRGAALLRVGGKMVYSTCSFNPIENEAVVAELIRRSDGALRLVPASLPGLIHRPGLSSWNVAWQSKTKSKKLRKQSDKNQPQEEDPLVWFTSFSKDIPAHVRGYRVTHSMFPPSDSSIHLEHCLRFLPHDQNTGGFFVAVLEKVAPLPGLDQQGLPAFEVNSPLGPKCYRYVCRLCGESGHYIQDCKLSKKSLAKQEQETPSSTPDDVDATPSDDIGVLEPLPTAVWEFLRDFYGLPPTFPNERLFARSHGTGIVSYVNAAVQTSCLAGPDLNLINTGVKIFTKFSTSQFKGYRPAQEGLEILVPFLGKRKVHVGWREFQSLVHMTSTRLFTDMEEATHAKFDHLTVGPAVVVLKSTAEDAPCIALAIWVGHASLSKLVSTADLNILDHDLETLDASQYEP